MIDEYKSQCKYNYYFEPVNLNQWDMFDKVESIGHIEPFLATKDMHIGDKLLLNVGVQRKSVETGVYAIAEIIKEPYILENSPEDYCNNKLTVTAKIEEINYLEPILNQNQCKLIFKQFRTVHKVSDEGVSLINKFIDNCIKQEDGIIELNKYAEGAMKKILVNAFERNSKARAECIKEFGYKCQICGFDFGEKYGAEFKNLIHVHHIKPLNEIRKDYIINPKTDLIPVCPNCHMVLHAKNRVYSINEIVEKINTGLSTVSR